MSTTSSATSDTVGATHQAVQFPNLANLANLISVKLDGDNYLDWKHHIVTIQKTMGLLSYLKKDISPPAEDSADRANWEKADGYVSACLNATLSPSIAHIAIGTSSASELWSAIEETWNEQLLAKQMQLKTQFQLMKQNDLSITSYCDKAKQLADTLKAAGESITDSTLVLQVLHGLNHNFTPIRLNIESSNVMLTFHQIKSKLLAYEARLEQESYTPPVNAMAAMTMKPPHHNNPDQTVICQICDKTGHRANTCYQLRFPQSQNNRGGGGGCWRSGNRHNRYRGGGRNNGNNWNGIRDNGNNWNGGQNSYGDGGNWSQNGGRSWPNTTQSANVVYGNPNPSSSYGNANAGLIDNGWLGGQKGPMAQPTNQTQFNNLNSNQGILGPGPSSSRDPSAFMGFGPSNFNSTETNPFIDPPHFGPSHFNSWAANQNTQHHGYSATVSDLCETIESWIPDSGATTHMTSDISLVHDAVPYTVFGRADPPPHAA